MDEKIEPTDAMVDEAANALSIDDYGTGLDRRTDSVQCAYLKLARITLRAALSHPDAAGLFADEDDRPWEPLKKGDSLNVGDEVRQDHGGITATAVVGRVDGGGNPWSANDGFIGWFEAGTWYVRRPVKELPEADGAVIVPADGHEYIETRVGKKSRRLTWDAECLVWYDARGTHLHGDITPGTWKVDDQ